MKNNQQSEIEIKSLMQKWQESLKQKNLEQMYRDYTEDHTLFDVGHSVKGTAAAKKLWEQCFPYFEEPEVHYKDLEIHTSDDMAVLFFKTKLTGFTTPIEGEMANSWLRGTVCYKKVEGDWKCIHEHISFPVNCETNQIIFEE